MITLSKRTNQTIYEEITKQLLSSVKPSEFLNRLSAEAEFADYPFIMLQRLKSTKQSKKHHPEGNVWNHTMLVLDEAAKVRDRSKEPEVFMWAALLHDIGKPDTTRIKKDRITAYDHDKAGEQLSEEFLRYFTEEEEFIRKVTALIRYHMHMLYVLKGLPYSDMKGLLRRVDAEELALLCRCDRLGRTGADTKKEEEQYRQFLAELKCMQNN